MINQNIMEHTHNIIEERAALAKKWLLNSQIQTLNNLKGSSFFGSFSSWFDLDRKMYPFVYSEITGYGITTLLFLNHQATDSSLVKRAEFAARWLDVVTAHKDGGFRCVISHEDNSFRHKEVQTYTFDAGVILNGFTNLYRATQKKQYLRTASDIVQWFSKMRNNDGILEAVYDIEKNEIVRSDESWSMQPGCYLAKNAIGILNFYDLTKDENAKKMAIELCDYALKEQEKDGRFLCSSKKHTNIHPHSYAAEGLLCAGIYLKEKKYIEAATRATEWVLSKQREDGAIPRLFLEEENYHQRMDGIAQTIRLATILIKKGCLDKKYNKNVEKLITLLLQHQYTDKSLNQDGGFLFGYSSGGEPIRNVNAWCTMFALQALQWYTREKIDDEEITRFFI